MSVLVKGMEMPTRCADCPFEYDSMLCRATGNSFIYRSAAEGGYVDFCDTRMPDCPLADVREDMDMVDLACWYDENILYPKRIEGKT